MNHLEFVLLILACGRSRQYLTLIMGRHAFQVGDRDMNRVFRLCKAQDLLISEQANERKSKRRSKLKRAVRRLRDRIRNLIDEVHKQLAVHLARSYDLVMIPKFEVSQMIRKVDRKIRSKTARQMATWPC